MLPAMVPQTWPLATQRLDTVLDERTQQPPLAQAFLAQQGWSGPPQRAQTLLMPLSWQTVAGSVQRVSSGWPLAGQQGSPGPPQPLHLPA
jgi:hypothetical protein